VFLGLCDKLRDDDMVDLGVAIDDRPDGKSLVKIVDKEVLLKQREEKKEVISNLLMLERTSQTKRKGTATRARTEKENGKVGQRKDVACRDVQD
jgi:cysteinyl-tRNA synthetase